MKVWKPATSYSLGREAGWDPLMNEVLSCLTPEAVEAWWADYLIHRHRNYPEVWSLALREACEAHADYLRCGDPGAVMDEAFRATVGT
jgi:hypothetical protein